MTRNQVHNIIIFIVALLCLATWIPWGLAQHWLWLSTQAAWRDTAAYTFRQVLQEEIGKRDDVPISYHGKTMTQAAYPFHDTLKFDRGDGWDTYLITKRQKRYALANDEHKNNIWEISLCQAPIQLDSLNAAWDRELKKHRVKSLTQIRYVAKAFVNTNTLAHSKDGGMQLAAADSLTSIFIGAALQREFIAYACFTGTWWSTLGWKDALNILIPLILLLFVLYYKKRIHDFFNRKPQVIVQKEIIREEVEVIKEVPVAMADGAKARIIRLPDGAQLNCEQATLTKGELTIRLTSQEVILLRQFLQKADNSLSSNEIADGLEWAQNSNPSQNVHNLVRNLRKKLKDIPNYKIVHSNRAYHFITAEATSDEETG